MAIPRAAWDNTHPLEGANSMNYPPRMVQPPVMPYGPPLHTVPTHMQQDPWRTLTPSKEYVQLCAFSNLLTS